MSEEGKLLQEKLDEMIRLLRLNVTQRPYIDQTYAVSQSQGFFLDYKDRKHLYIFSATALTLTIGTIGTLNVAANTWTDISFPPNLQIFATGQVTAVLVLVRATDETINGASNGADTNVNLNQVNGAALSPTNPVPVSQGQSATGTPTSVAGNAAAVALLAANTNRKAAYIFNDSTATLYIGLFAHATLTTTNYTTQIPANVLWEMPIYPVYTGEISGIWASATGNARITEMT